MPDTADFPELVAGLRSGDRAAVDRICREYGPFLRAAVRRQLHPALRTRFDSLDFVQDVWASFLSTPSERYAFETPDALLAFLARVAHNKLVDVARRRFASERDAISREAGVALDPTEIDLPAPDPSPSQCAIAGEAWDQMLDRFPKAHRVILERLREGYTYADIARLSGVGEATVKRIVRRLKSLADPDPGSGPC